MFLKFGVADAELPQKFLIEGRTDLAPAVDRDRDCAAIRVTPALMTASLTAALKSKAHRGSAEIIRASTRHSRFQWYRPAKEYPFRDARLQ